MVHVPIDGESGSDNDDEYLTLLKRAAGETVRCMPPAMSPALVPFVVSAQDGYKLYALIRDVLDLLDSWGVEHWLCAGTLLGAIRHGGVIPWDDDVPFCRAVKSLAR